MRDREKTLTRLGQPYADGAGGIGCMGTGAGGLDVALALGCEPFPFKNARKLSGLAIDWQIGSPIVATKGCWP